MALSLISVDTVPVTKNLARKFRDMTPLRNERGLLANRAKKHVRLLEQGNFFTPLWGSCECGGVIYRGNGNHTSHVLLACMQAANGGLDGKSKEFVAEYLLTKAGEWQGRDPADLPKVAEGAIKAMVEHYRADAEEDLVTFFQRYDPPSSSRNRDDQLGVYIGERPELSEMSRRKVRYALAGVMRAAKYDPAGFSLPATFAQTRFSDDDKGAALRIPQVVKAVKWIVETVPDDGLYKQPVGAQVCAEIYANYGEYRGEEIVTEMMRQIEEEADPTASWEQALTKKRNKPTAESLLKRGRTVVKEIVKKKA